MSISSRIQSIESHLENAYKKLGDLGIDLTDTDKNLDNIATVLEEYYDEQPKVSATDVTEATLDGTKVGKLKLDLKGHSEQETTEGYNLFSKNQVSQTNNGITTNITNYNVFTINGTSSSGANWYSLDRTNIKIPAGTYTFSLYYDSGTNSNPGSFFTFLRPRGGSSNLCSLISPSSSNLIRSATFTVEQETDIDIYGYCAAGITLTNFVMKLQLEEGSTAHDYEPFTYGASPNPSYEQPIKSAGDNVNLFDGEFINGSESVPDSIYYLFSKNDLKLKNNTYTFNNSLPNSFSYAVMGCINSFPNGDTKQYNSGWKTGGTPLTFSFSQELYFGVLIKKSNGSTIQPEDIISYKFNLQQGTIAFPYSPYGQGCITEKIINKNWFKLPESQTINGITITKHENGRLLINGTTNAITQFVLNTFPANGKYTFNYTIVSGSVTGITSITCRDANTSTLYIEKGMANMNNMPKTFEATNTSIRNVLYFANGAVFDNLLVEIQLEKGPSATNFVAHEEQTKTYYTQAPFRSIGDVRDVFFKNTVDSPYYDSTLTLNAWYERHIIKERRLTSSTDISISGNYGVDGGFYRFYIDEKKNGIDDGEQFMMCNLLSSVRLGNSADHSDEIGFMNCSNIELRFRTHKGTLNLDALKEWLDDNELYFYYVLIKNIVNLPCTQSQIDILENLPKSYAGQTNVYSIDEIKAYIDVAALKGE